jgi:hypothetical protein
MENCLKRTRLYSYVSIGCLASIELRDLCIEYIVGHPHNHIRVLLFCKGTLIQL